jgi:hypothetical protein
MIEKNRRRRSSALTIHESKLWRRETATIMKDYQAKAPMAVTGNADQSARAQTPFLHSPPEMHSHDCTHRWVM